MNDFGAPTKYQDNYPEKALAYFTREAYMPLMLNGQAVVNPKTNEIELVTSDFPTIEGLGRHLDVWHQTIEEWRKKYSDFDVACKAGIARAKHQLIQGAMQNRYNAGFSQFVAKNCCGMVDRKETSVSGNLTLDQILGEIDGKS